MSVSYKDYYKVLEVDRSAKTEEIDKAYKRLARKHHPDLNQGDSGAEDRFKEINEAHEVLKDTEKRRLYDQLGPNWQSGQGNNRNFNFQGGQDFGGGDFSDFFEMVFGQGGSFGGFSSPPRRGRDVEVDLHLSLEDVVKGGPKSFSLNSQEGVKNLNVNIPMGIKDAAKLRLSGQGRSGTPNGDLYVTVRYQKHPFFKVDGIHVNTEIMLSPWEAVLGTKIRVPTLEGNVEMNIPAGSDSGRKLRLKGKGLGNASGRGDEYVIIGIKVPRVEVLTDKEKELWQELAQLAEITKETEETEEKND